MAPSTAEAQRRRRAEKAAERAADEAARGVKRQPRGPIPSDDGVPCTWDEHDACWRKGKGHQFEGSVHVVRANAKRKRNAEELKQACITIHILAARQAHVACAGAPLSEDAEERLQSLWWITPFASKGRGMRPQDRAAKLYRQRLPALLQEYGIDHADFERVIDAECDERVAADKAEREEVARRQQQAEEEARRRKREADLANHRAFIQARQEAIVHSYECLRQLVATAVAGLVAAGGGCGVEGEPHPRRRGAAVNCLRGTAVVTIAGAIYDESHEVQFYNIKWDTSEVTTEPKENIHPELVAAFEKWLSSDARLRDVAFSNHPWRKWKCRRGPTCICRAGGYSMFEYM